MSKPKKMPLKTEHILVARLPDGGQMALTWKYTKDGREVDHHTEQQFTVVGDELQEGGMRVLHLAPRDQTKREKQVAEIIDKVCGSIKDGSETMRALLADVLITQWDEAIDDLHQRIFAKGAKIKAQPGCFKIIVGDGRKKDHRELMLRD